MKKLTIFILFMLYSFLTFSQLNFKKGYFIDNDDNKINCFIKVRDWVDNPEYFQYKADLSGNIMDKFIGEAKEFSVEKEFRFVRAIVEIDMTDNRLDKLQENKEPVMEFDTIYLKTLVFGKANLYSFDYKSTRVFFYNVGNNEIKQLIYKKYLFNGTYLKENKTYIMQLKTDVRCNDVIIPNNVGYFTSELVDYFLSYNKCEGYIATKFKRKMGRMMELFLSPSFGIGYYNLSAWDKNAGLVDYKCENSIAPIFGFEIQYILPFAKNRFGLIFEPGFQEIGGSAKDYVGEPKYIEYSVPNLSFGARYYLRLTPRSYFHFNPTYNLTLVRKFSGRSYYREYSLQRFSAGIGFTYLNKYSIEFKYFPDFKNQSGFNQAGLLFRYTI